MDFFNNLNKNIIGDKEDSAPPGKQSTLLLALRNTITNRINTFVIDISDEKNSIYGPLENIILYKNGSLIEFAQQKMCKFELGNSQELNLIYIKRDGKKIFPDSDLVPCEELPKRTHQELIKNPNFCKSIGNEQKYCKPDRICTSLDFKITYIDEKYISADVKTEKHGECLVSKKQILSGWTLKKVWSTDDAAQKSLSYESVYGQESLRSLHRSKSQEYVNGRPMALEFDCPVVENWGIKFRDSAVPSVEDHATWLCGDDFKFGQSDNFKDLYARNPMEQLRGPLMGYGWVGNIFYSPQNDYKVLVNNAGISVLPILSAQNQALANLRFEKENEIVMAFWLSGDESKKAIEAFQKSYKFFFKE